MFLIWKTTSSLLLTEHLHVQVLYHRKSIKPVREVPVPVILTSVTYKYRLYCITGLLKVISNRHRIFNFQ